MRRSATDLDGWWRAAVAVVGPILRVLFRIRVAGSDAVPAGAAILAANHVSALDGVVLAVTTATRCRRITRFLVAAEFFARSPHGWVLRRFRQISVRRGAQDAAALDDAVATIAGGGLAGIFPEGRVNPTPGEGLQRGHTGVARIALAARAPVVPVGIWGTQRRWPLGGLRFGPPLRPTVALAYGDAIEPRGDPGSREDVEAFAAEVMRRIERQLLAARGIAER